jgi:hypothetical protein
MYPVRLKMVLVLDDGISTQKSIFAIFLAIFRKVSPGFCLRDGLLYIEGQFLEMNEDLKEILTVTEVAGVLRCSKNQVQLALEGKLPGLPRMTHLVLGQRKVVRREWLREWMESNKAS